MNNKIFISGCISGLKESTIKYNFDLCEKYYNKWGYEVVNPLNLCKNTWPWWICMVVCVYNMLKCDEVFFMWNYKESKLAMIEFKIASFLRKDMHFMRKKDFEQYV